MKIYDLNREDRRHLREDPNVAKPQFEDIKGDIQVDPDGQLSPRMRKKFWSVIKDYSSLFRKEPGRYNGASGLCDNSINFCDLPPSNKKIHMANMTLEQKKVMADKMDKLVAMGVMKYPEQVGITPEFTSPSMVIPKGTDSPGEYRLVTCFQQLNRYIKKMPAVSPTISEAKSAIAQSKYFISLDLSNFFYQSGMPVEDVQYLATLHPLNGHI